ncbi:hypothetical protein, partial [Cyclobacterium amurskyense]|uniref:hypothetical protein n=1 Tax=Cyclobacterium amurskyense TaxID=320787 RepID=UPI0030D927BA
LFTRFWDDKGARYFLNNHGNNTFFLKKFLSAFIYIHLRKKNLSKSIPDFLKDQISHPISS